MSATVHNRFPSHISSSRSKIDDSQNLQRLGTTSSSKSITFIESALSNQPKTPATLPPSQLPITGSAWSINSAKQRPLKTLTYEQKTTEEALTGLKDPSKSNHRLHPAPLDPERTRKRSSSKNTKSVSFNLSIDGTKEPTQSEGLTGSSSKTIGRTHSAPSSSFEPTEKQNSAEITKTISSNSRMERSHEPTQSEGSTGSSSKTIRRAHSAPPSSFEPTEKQNSAENLQPVSPNSSTNSPDEPVQLEVMMRVHKKRIQGDKNLAPPEAKRLDKLETADTALYVPPNLDPNKTQADKNLAPPEAKRLDKLETADTALYVPPNLHSNTTQRFALHGKASMIIMGLISGLLGSLAMTGGGAALIALFKAALKDSIATESTEMSQEISSEEVSNSQLDESWIPSEDAVQARTDELIEAARAEFEAIFSGETPPESAYSFSPEELHFFSMGLDPNTASNITIDSDACQAYFEKRATLELYEEHYPTLFSTPTPSTEALIKTNQELQQAFKENPDDPVLNALFDIKQNGEIEASDTCVDAFVYVTCQLELARSQIDKFNEITSKPESEEINIDYNEKNDLFHAVNYIQLLQTGAVSGSIFTTFGTVGSLMFSGLLIKQIHKSKVK